MSEEKKETVRPRFYIHPVQNKAKSDKEGRPIFEPKSFVELRHPGDRLYSFVDEIDEHGRSLAKRADGTPVSDYSERFPRDFAAFKRGEERAAVGTPLEEWSALSRSRAAELKALNILTVEELADVQDGALDKMGMGARAEREKARTFLAASKGGAETNAMAARIAQLEEMVARLTAPVAQTITTDLRHPLDTPDVPIEQATDAQLKEYIKRETGQAPRGTPSRDTLLNKAKEIAAA